MDIASLLAGVISSIIATALLAILAWSRGWINFSWLSLRHVLLLSKRMNDAGIVNFYASRDDYAKYRGAPRLLDYLNLAHRSITVAAYWMAHGIEMEGIAESIAEMTRKPHNKKVVIGIINPTASYIDALSLYLDMETKELIVRVQSSLYHLWRAREKLSSEEKKRFQIKVYTTVPIASVIILDAEETNGSVQIDLKAYKTSRHNSFAFELKKRGHSLYDLWLASTLKLLDDSEEFNPSKHLIGFIEKDL